MDTELWAWWILAAVAQQIVTVHQQFFIAASLIVPWPFLLKQAQISARRILPSRRWVRSRMTTRAPGVADWATAAMRRTGLDTQYALRGAFRACGLAVAAGGLAPCKSFVATSYASSSRRPIGTTMPSRWPWMLWLTACLPRLRLL